MAIFLTRRGRRLASALVLLLGLATWTPDAHAQVVAVVNGMPITEIDVQQRGKLIQLSTHKPASRQEALNDLVDDKLKLFITKRYSLEATDTEIDSAFDDMARRIRMTTPQFVQSLAGAGVSPNTIKSRLRSELVWSQLVRGKFGSTLQVGDSDIAAALQNRQSNEKDSVGYLFTLRPILFLTPRGSSTDVIEARRRDAEGLRARFQSCDEGVVFARALKDVAVRDIITRSSADLTPELRELLAGMTVGKLTNPEVTPQGVQVFALCEKKQSSAEAANKREAREEIFSKRFSSEGKKFLDEVRRAAMIEYR